MNKSLMYCGGSPCIDLKTIAVWFIRRMLKVLWIDKISNERVLTIANIKV